MLEELFQVEAANGGGGFIKAAAQLDLPARLLNQTGRNVEGFRFAVNEHRDLTLRMKELSVGAATSGTAAGAFALDERAGKHFAERTEASDEIAAEFKIGIAGRFHMTLILVSESDKVKGPKRFARMTSIGNRIGKGCKQTN